MLDPGEFYIFASKENVVIAADMVRRVLKCSMDADMEDPEKRVFKRNPLAEILADRGKFVAAVLTVCRAYIEHGMHKRRQPVKLWYLSSFFRHERAQAGRVADQRVRGAKADRIERAAHRDAGAARRRAFGSVIFIGGDSGTSYFAGAI